MENPSRTGNKGERWSTRSIHVSSLESDATAHLMKRVDLSGKSGGHDEAWLQQAEEIWGNRPQIEYLDTLMILDNRHDEILEFPEAK